MVRNFRSLVEPSTANYSYPDAPCSEQEVRSPEEEHAIAIMEKDATISSKVEEISKLESKFRDLQASSARQFEESKSAAAKKRDSIKADNIALRKTLHVLKLSHQAVSIDHEKKLASNEEDLLKFRANLTRQLEEAKSAADKKHSFIEADNAALRVTLDELKLSHKAASIDQEMKLALKEEDLLKFRANSTRQLEEAKSAAAKKQSSIEADNAALRETLDNLKLSHQTASMEQDKKLASKEEDLLKSSISSTRQLEEAKLAAAKKQSSIEADNTALREALENFKLRHQVASMEQDNKLASKDEDLLKFRASSTHQLEEAKSAAAKKQSSIEADNAALHAALDELKLSHQATSIKQDKKFELAIQSLHNDLRNDTKMLKDELDSKNKLLKDKEVEANLFFEAHAAELQRLRMSHAKEILEFEKWGQKKLQDMQVDHSKAMSQAKDNLAKAIKELERRQTTIKFSAVEEAVGSDLQSQLQHHSDYVTRLDRWLPNGLASRKEKLTGLRPKGAQGQEELETLYCTEHPAYTEELLFAEAGGPNIRLPPKPRAETDSSSSAEEEETRCCTEYLLFAKAGSPRVRLPNKAQEAPKPVPLPAQMDPVGIPLPEDEDLDLLAPEWIPLPEEEDAELLDPEWIPLPEEEDLEFLMPGEIPLPSDEDLDLLPDLPDSEDLDLAPRGPTTKPPTFDNKESRAIPPRGAPKAPKAMLALNVRGGPKRGSSSRGSSWSRGGWGSYI